MGTDGREPREIRGGLRPLSVEEWAEGSCWKGTGSGAETSGPDQIIQVTTVTLQNSVRNTTRLTAGPAGDCFGVRSVNGGVCDGYLSDESGCR